MGAADDAAQLTEPQLAILRVVWARGGEASVPDVWRALFAERGLAPSTISTTMARLARRGLLTRRLVNKQHRYRATVSEEQVRRAMVGDLTTTLFAGDAAALLAHLVRAGEVSAEDLARAERLLDDAD